MQVADTGGREITDKNGWEPDGDNSSVGGLIGNAGSRRHKQFGGFENNSNPP
jgi:hypothetical protein